MILEAAAFCLALTLYHEGDKRDGRFTEPLDGLFAIGQAVLTRAGRKPERVCAEVQKYKQFSWTLQPPPVEQNKAWQDAQAVARLSFHMADFTGGATHFWAFYASPYWKSDMEILGQWGNHIFGKPKGKK